MEQLGYTRYNAKDLEELIPGDLLCCSGHVEFYYGYRFRYNEDTESYTDELERVPVSNGHYTSTFGWGKVFPSFPNSDSYFYKSGDIFKKNGDIREYDIVYRRETDELNIEVVKEMLDNE